MKQLIMRGERRKSSSHLYLPKPVMRVNQKSLFWKIVILKKGYVSKEYFLFKNIQERKIKDDDDEQVNEPKVFEILKSIRKDGSKVDQVEIIEIDEESVGDSTRKFEKFEDNKSKNKDNNYLQGIFLKTSKKVRVKSIK